MERCLKQKLGYMFCKNIAKVDNKWVSSQFLNHVGFSYCVFDYFHLDIFTIVNGL